MPTSHHIMSFHLTSLQFISSNFTSKVNIQGHDLHAIIKSDKLSLCEWFHFQLSINIIVLKSTRGQSPRRHLANSCSFDQLSLWSWWLFSCTMNLFFRQIMLHYDTSTRPETRMMVAILTQIGHVNRYLFSINSSWIPL